MSANHRAAQDRVGRGGRRHLRAAAATAVTVGLLLTAATACSRSKGTIASGGSSATTTGGTSAAPVSSTFGSLAAPVCGPAGSGSGSTGKPGTGLNVQGVTPSSIRLGTISDPGYSGLPGLDQELFDASEVFVKWCNSLGGINGRKIILDKLDAALFHYNAAVAKACTQDFSLVGGGGALDDSGQNTRLSCLLPDFPAFVASVKARGADLMVQAANTSSNTKGNFGIARYLNATFPAAKSSVGYLTAGFSTDLILKQQFEEAGKQNGWKTTYDAQYNVTGEPTWAPFANTLKQKGVKGLVWVGEPTSLAKLLSALDLINYKLDWVMTSSNDYDKSLISGAGSALNTNPVYVTLGTTPFEATQVPAIKQYSSLFDTYLPNGKKTASLGQSSFSAWLLFAQSVKACGANVTRSCVLEQAAKTTSFDGGGLTATVNPSTPETPTSCFAVVKATTSGFKVIRWQPNKLGVYNCDPANVVTFAKSYGTPAKLSDVGKSTTDLH
jgi:ABC-type branched-subunit amino acid transport system substrate-binding protein